MTSRGMAMEARVLQPPASRHGHNNVNLSEENMRRKRAKSIHKEHERENLVTSGRIFIDTFLSIIKTYKPPPGICKQYLKKLLHAIFFFGQINDPQIPPEEFIPDHLQNSFRQKIPEIFEQRKTHLARQTPYSILLEFLVYYGGNKENPNIFMEILANINKSLGKPGMNTGDHLVANDFALTASIIAYSRYTDINVTRIAYGSSMSCKGKIPRQIMVIISTLHVWDKAISYAVCSDGDGPAIRFPNKVQCQAYSFEAHKCNYKMIPSYMTCDKLFKNVNAKALFLKSTDERPGRIGSYAETESFSNLLQCCPCLQNMTVTERYQDQNQMNRDQIVHTFQTQYEEKLTTLLKELLCKRHFCVPEAGWLFFTPT